MPSDIPAEIIDSLPVVSAHDIFGRAVELMSGAALPAAGEPAWRKAVPAEVFGAKCTLVTEVPYVADTNRHLTDTVEFQASVLVLVVAYMAILLRSSGYMRTIIGAVFHRGGVDPSMIDEPDSKIMTRLMGGITLFGILLAGIVTIKIVDLLLDADTAASIPDVIRSTAPLTATAAIAAIILWQLLLHRVVAWVCRNTQIKKLGNISYIFFSAGALLLFPLSSLMLLGHDDISSVWVIISVIGIGFICLLYLKETFMFFTSKKISILYWFLYLCSVIALPVSLICLIAADLQ